MAFGAHAHWSAHRGERRFLPVHRFCADLLHAVSRPVKKPGVERAVGGVGTGTVYDSHVWRVVGPDWTEEGLSHRAVCNSVAGLSLFLAATNPEPGTGVAGHCPF